jgi:hypothetical protein
MAEKVLLPLPRLVTISRISFFVQKYSLQKFELDLRKSNRRNLTINGKILGINAT